MNFKGFLLVLIVTCEVYGQSRIVQKCGIKNRASERIVGGNPVTKQGEWPWLVTFFYKFTGSFFCSGSLISQKHVVSGKFYFY